MLKSNSASPSSTEDFELNATGRSNWVEFSDLKFSLRNLENHYRTMPILNENYKIFLLYSFEDSIIFLTNIRLRCIKFAL